MDQQTTHKSFLTQKELAKRWRMAESSIKNWRERGHLCYFQLPGSTRVLYPVEAVEEIESTFTTPAKEVVDKTSKKTEISRRKPEISSKPQKEWRV
ncbi:DNA-binding protein [Thermodesulfobacteriota bacterium]